ncbi:sugar ABC transporter permease [Nocardioides sp. SOB77]|uniref:Sugar ABC transporter permease n=1 Tax=Nocardioides oceani TaxID=3058369 RepID=A0ABT8FK27_9ACTN|nr:sugar ABC transporter permease [Nocardioides oceani]MDN4175036.1 sugar ABC transporter permease [Nocardioides oceani]
MAAPVTNPAPATAAAETVGAGGPDRPARRRGDGIVAWLFLAPYLVLFGAFVLAPIVLGIWISLHSWDFTLPGKPFVGLDNYADLFDPDSVSFDPFWNSMQATGIFTLFSVPLLIVVPLAVAMVMNQKFRGRNVFRAIYFAPYVLGVAVVGVMWRFLLDRNIGAVNSYLGAIGLPGDTAWLSSVPAAWVALVGVTVWWTLGFNAVIYIAGLQDIPRELYEAAEIDGASRWSSFRHVTLPGLRPVTMFVTLVTIIASANMFGQAFIMTNGAPARETQTAIFYIAETGLQNFQMGQAAAASWILTLALMLLSVVVFAVFRARGEVEPS